MSGIPVIDMERDSAAEELVSAFRTIGFATLTGHGVDPETMQAAFDASSQFFSLPLETKLESKYQSHSSNRGYIAFQTEFHSADLSELKETFDIGWDDDDNDSCEYTTPWPAAVSSESDNNMKDKLMSYFQACDALHLRVMRLLGEGMHLPDSDFFVKRCHEKHVNLRLLHYPELSAKDYFCCSNNSALSSAENEKQDPAVVVRGGRHTDFGTITLLAQDAVGGLRVQRRGEDSWTPVPPVPNSFIVNVGDMLQRWTNDRLVATPHQVVHYFNNSSSSEAIIPERFSIAFFCNANREVILDPSEFTEPGESPNYETVKAIDYITSRLTATIAK